MTKQQADKIRKMVDQYGWDAVRNHPELGPIWRAALAEQRRIENRIDT